MRDCRASHLSHRLHREVFKNSNYLYKKPRACAVFLLAGITGIERAEDYKPTETGLSLPSPFIRNNVRFEMHFTHLPKPIAMQRKQFIKSSLIGAAGLSSISAAARPIRPVMAPDPKSLYVIGPVEGYSPQIGTLVSMLNYNRSTIIGLTKGMTMEELDHLYDAKSNSIGALILHLGAVDKYYQVNSFEGRDFTDAEKKTWGPALELGEDGRKIIKGKELKYYIDLITETREKTLAEFRKKDDNWLAAVDPKFGDGKTAFNTYWKWFHVCEHESNHRGQIAWLKKRLPGARESAD